MGSTAVAGWKRLFNRKFSRNPRPLPRRPLTLRILFQWREKDGVRVIFLEEDKFFLLTGTF
jgi:hypothetical protein